ncbi:MAG: hypothetical protein ABW128_14355, partial [Rhizorhabdus sp.]
MIAALSPITLAPVAAVEAAPAAGGSAAFDAMLASLAPAPAGASAGVATPVSLAGALPAGKAGDVATEPGEDDASVDGASIDPALTRDEAADQGTVQGTMTPALPGQPVPPPVAASSFVPPSGTESGGGDVRVVLAGSAAPRAIAVATVRSKAGEAPVIGMVTDAAMR